MHPNGQTDADMVGVQPADTDISNWTHERARVASLSRSRNDDDPDLVNARRNLKAERLALHIARIVAEAPTLTGEQRDRLALLLRGGGGQHGDA
jgi:hypothetical protein